jgi:hypothetical protein
MNEWKRLVLHSEHFRTSSFMIRKRKGVTILLIIEGNEGEVKHKKREKVSNINYKNVSQDENLEHNHNKDHHLDRLVEPSHNEKMSVSRVN